MKANNITATVVALAAGVQSQNSTSNGTSSVAPSVVYEYVNDCPESESGVVTATSVVTYCHLCEAAGMTMYPGGSLTTYTTTYMEVCPTGGLQDKTYTVTEPCPSSGALERSADHVPQGFTTTEAPCGCPENTPVPITTPGPALASAQAAGIPAVATAVPTPAAAAPGGKAAPESPAGAPGTGASPAGGSSPKAGSESSPEAAPAGGAPAAAPGAPAAAAAPPYATPAGAENKAVSPSASGAPATNGTVPFLGSAAQMTPSMPIFAAIVALIPLFVLIQ